MANSLRRVANYLGLMDDPEFDAEVVAPVRERVRTSDVKIKTREPRLSVTPSTSNYSAPTTPQAVQLEVPVLDRIVTLHPRFYSEARTVGEHYREGNPVIMNLTDMDDAERRRIIDFASGLVFGHNGKIERVTSKVFLLSPANISVSNEDKSAAAEASFFNHS